MRKELRGEYFFKKDIGKVRITNEDNVKISVNSKSDVLMVLADGMGGAKKGDYASFKAVSQISENFESKKGFFTYYNLYKWCAKQIKNVNKDLYQLSDKDINYKGMGTTLVLVVIRKKRILVFSLGDSRCYILKNNKLIKVTEDQTYTNYLYNSGKIKESEIATHPDRHTLTNAVGIYPSVSFDFYQFEYQNESILLCSDGIYNNVLDIDLENILKTNDNPETKVNSIINLANFNGGSDNESCALWESLDD